MIDKNYPIVFRAIGKGLLVYGESGRPQTVDILKVTVCEKENVYTNAVVGYEPIFDGKYIIPVKFPWKLYSKHLVYCCSCISDNYELKSFRNGEGISKYILQINDVDVFEHMDWYDFDRKKLQASMDLLEQARVSERWYEWYKNSNNRKN